MNFINRKLVDFIVKLGKCSLNEHDRLYLTTAIRSISDLERVGAQYLSLSMNAERIADHFMNIAHTIKVFR